MESEKHRSPDGALTLVIERDDSDTRIGFAESEWHVHADMLVGSWGETPEAAARRYAEAILASVASIGVLMHGDSIVYAWVSEDPAFDADMAQQAETLRFRLWDGRDLPEPPLSRKVRF